MSGALPQQPEEFLDHVRNVPREHVPSVEEELDEYLMLREVKLEMSKVVKKHSCSVPVTSPSQAETRI